MVLNYNIFHSIHSLSILAQSLFLPFVESLGLLIKPIYEEALDGNLGHSSTITALTGLKIVCREVFTCLIMFKPVRTNTLSTHSILHGC